MTSPSLPHLKSLPRRSTNGSAILPSETEVPFKYLGEMKDFKGVDIDQDSVLIHCANYLGRVMETHGWGTPSPGKSLHPGSLLPTDCISQLYNEQGYAEHTTEHDALLAKYKFGYRQLLGELLYAYFTCQPDIGYAVITLNKCDFHFAMMLKHLAFYLHQTRHWGIIFHKRKPDLHEPKLPLNPVPFLLSDKDLPPFPLPSADDFAPACFVDAAHANDLRTCQSGAISYRCKTQTVTTTSSTEAEFYAAVIATKQAKYLRVILKDLGFTLPGPTVIHCDNQSMIQMINSSMPTEHSCHICIHCPRLEGTGPHPHGVHPRHFQQC